MTPRGTLTFTIEAAASANNDVPIDPYVQAHARVRSECCFHYRSPQFRDFAASIRTSSHMLTRYSLRELSQRIEPAARLDLAIRCLIAPGLTYGDAYQCFNRLVDQHSPHYISCPRLRRQAHSGAVMAAHSEFRRLIDELGVDFDEDQFPGGHGQDPGDPHHWMYAAVYHSMCSVELGLVSHAIILANSDYKIFDSDFWELLAKGPLLDAMEEFAARDLMAETRLRFNVVNEGSRYICAAEGCGVRAVHKQGLQACGGRCSPDVKPHYCSKSCQTKDWRKHKQLCKPSEEIPVQAMAIAIVASAKEQPSTPGHAQARGTTWAQRCKILAEPGPGHFVELNMDDIFGQPGHGTLRVDSHTIAPEDLRELRDEYEATLRHYAKSFIKSSTEGATTVDEG